MGWVSQKTYVPTVWGNGGKPGGPTPPPPDPGRSTPAPVAKDDEDTEE
jgi:hypothetical protein